MSKKLFHIVLIYGCFVLNAQTIELSVQKGHSGDINVVVFNEDGSLLASAGTDRQVKIWHVPTGKEMASFISPSNEAITNLTFTQQSDFLLAKCADGSLIQWDVRTSKQDQDSKVSDFSFPSYNNYRTRDSSDVFQTDRFYLKRKNRKSGKTVFAKVPVDISKVFRAFVVSEKHNRVLAANEDGRIYVYDALKGKSLVMLEGHYASANSIALSPDENLAASASSDRSIILWDVKTLKQVRRLYAFAFRFETIAFDHSGNQLAVGDELGRGRVIDLVSSRVKVSTFQWHDQKVSDIAFSADDKTIYTAGYDNRIKSFDATSGNQSINDSYKLYFSSGDFLLKLIGAYREPYAWVNTLAVSPDGQYVASGGGWRESDIRHQAQSITLKNLVTNKLKVLKTHQQHVSSLFFIGTKKFVSAGPNNLLLWYFDDYTNDYLFHELPVGGIKDITKVVQVGLNQLLISSGKKLFLYNIDRESIVDSLQEDKDITDISYRSTDSLIAYSSFDKLVLLRGEFKGKRNVILKAHNDKITSLDLSPSRTVLATCSWDATVKLWNTTSAELMATIISIGKDDHIIITPDNYYYGTRHSFRGFGFKYGKQFISPEQFDLRFNRPDIVLDRLDFVPKNVVNSFNRAYRKRLQKMKFTEDMLSAEVQLPQASITSELVAVVNNPQLQLGINVSDKMFELDRINVFVNNIPVFGSSGIDLRARNTKSVDENITINLSPGNNKIQVSCLNSKGVESLLQTRDVIYEIDKAPKPNLYLTVISVSKYQDAKMNLKYAVKDGKDIVTMFSKSTGFDKIVIDSIYNERATKENILSLHDKFMQTSVNDHVVIYVSGHGLLDENLDFYFATNPIDFRNPAVLGVRYDDLENLLDGIPARNKLLLMDACHSGEVDKGNITVSEKTITQTGTKGAIKSYSYPVEAETEHYQVGIKTSFELMQEIFSNLSKGSGAVVISAAAGNSYALESDDWKNGIFTYSFLNGIKSKAADTNHDGEISVTEIKDYVSKEVERLTDGAQKPTSRRENLEFDFRVY